MTVDTAFKAVIAGCAAPQPGRDDTWINKRIRDLYVGLHELGHCHSVEVWQDGDLVGGLYGVSLGRAFFGESMFHRARDASKVALVHLVARLIAGGFELLDTQYVTEHLRSFGAVEIPQAPLSRAARRRSRRAGGFHAVAASISGAERSQIIAKQLNRVPGPAAARAQCRASESSPRATVPAAAHHSAGPRHGDMMATLPKTAELPAVAAAVVAAERCCGCGWNCGCGGGPGGRGAACFGCGGRFCGGRRRAAFGGSGCALTMVWSGPLQSVSQMS